MGEFEHLELEDWFVIHHAFLKRFTELLLRDYQRDIDSFDELDTYEKLAKMAYWHRWIELVLGVSSTMTGYENERGKFRLVARMMGPVIGLPASELKRDVDTRLEWLKRRTAGDFEREFKSLVDERKWSSPGLMDTIRPVRGECHYAENEEPLCA